MRLASGLVAGLSWFAIGTASGQGKATIYRDPWGVPHIYADREEDGYYALGYATAEDQADFILRIALTARGEAAKAFGTSSVQSDYTSRLWRHAEESKLGFGRMSPALQVDYRRWVQGFNQYLTDHPEHRPAWAITLEHWDPVAISRWLLWLSYQAGDGLRKCQAGGVKLSAVSEVALARRQVMASNEWVVAPWRTSANATVMLSDPHGEVDGTFVYEFRLHAGPFEAAGYAMGAMPLLVQTRNLAWGMTTGAPSVADCYRVALVPGSETRYLYDGKPLEIKREKTIIQVKDGQPVTRTLEYTRHNGILTPVVAREPGTVYVVATPYMDRSGDFDEELHRMVLARNVAELKDAMRIQGMFPQNVMAGDRFGGSFYLRAGLTPKRPTGIAWDKVLDGNTSATAWLGLHPMDDLVQIETPASGYMQNDNISPAQMFIGSPLTPDRYPAYIYNDSPERSNSRGRRTVEVLSRSLNFSVEDAKALALDEKWIETDVWQEALRRSLAQDFDRTKALSADAKRLAHDILAFDGFARVDSKAALGFWFWRTTLLDQVKSAGAMALRAAGAPGAEPSAEVAKSAIDALVKASETVARLRTNPCPPPSGSGCPMETLGDVFRIGRGGKSSYPVGGVALAPDDKKLCESLASWNLICVHTLRAFTGGPPDSSGRRFMTIGSRLLRLTIFTDPIQSFTLHNFGQSGHPDSPHYEDQVKMTSRHELKPVLFDKAELMPQVKSEKALTIPELPPQRGGPLKG